MTVNNYTRFYKPSAVWLELGSTAVLLKHMMYIQTVINMQAEKSSFTL